MKGASLPPYQSEPPARGPAAPIIPRVDVEDAELVETLTLPPRATDERTVTNVTKVNAQTRQSETPTIAPTK